MKEEQKKIELLQMIAHRLNEAHVQWALGASMLLYFKSITSEFHDIDLIVADHDAECVRTIISLISPRTSGVRRLRKYTIKDGSKGSFSSS